jgi:hypothetical protein
VSGSSTSLNFARYMSPALRVRSSIQHRFWCNRNATANTQDTPVAPPLCASAMPSHTHTHQR